MVHLGTIEKVVSRNQRFAFTLISYVVVLGMYLNSSTYASPVLGITAFTAYFLINGIFLANAFFKKEEAFFRLMLGFLSLLMLLGVLGWVIMIIDNLDILRSVSTLLITATVASLLNRKGKSENATQ